jgi:hypothetical protein
MNTRTLEAMTTHEPNPRPIIVADPPIIVASEIGGGYQIGWHDGAPSFPSRSFAEDVLTRTLMPRRPSRAETARLSRAAVVK